MSDRGTLVRVRDRALDDLVEVRRQVADGELDEATAAPLIARYEREAADAITALDTAPAADPGAAGRSRRRVLLGVAIFVVAAAAVVAGLVAAIEPRTDPTVTADTGATVDLAAVSNEEMEAVVAANPDVVPMRLALARRYVEAGDFSAALPHYLYILERETNPEALTYVGWMTYVSGDAVTGTRLLEQALVVAPGDPLASWFLGNVRFAAGDMTGAVPLLQTVIDSGQAPADIVAEARRMIEEAQR